MPILSLSLRQGLLLLISLLCLTLLPQPAVACDLFDRSNLVAWCIVPFDAAKRSPAERAEMLARLGIRQLAYDWRAEHIPQFDEEVAAMQRHGIRITAWWIAPPDLSDVNRTILDVVRRHQLKLQFWALVPDPPADLSQEQKVAQAAAALRPLAEEAGNLGCQVALYNHGGWFGEPENQLAIVKALDLPQVGIVYNLHHGHAHLDRFPQILAELKPHLLALNLNGMLPRGDELGQKILPLGAGSLDLKLLQDICASGWRGPIGILNHTDLDAEQRLADNLAGLDWLLPQLKGEPPGPRPKMQTYEFPAEPVAPESSSSEGATTPEPTETSAFEQLEIETLLDQALVHGNATRGAFVFGSAKFACISCHRIGKQGGNVGPDLSRVGTCLKPEEIVSALLWPKRTVKPEYAATAVATTDGVIHQGYVVRTSDSELVLREATSGQELTIPQAEVDDRQSLGSLMPDGLMAAMSDAQRRDVIRFLLELGHAEHDHAQLLEQVHGVTPFEFDKAPLDPSQWRFANHPVNRDRIYDFYAKQADHFRTLEHPVAVLPEFPGLDGGTLGHWGNQTEETWRDDRWNQTELGSVMSGIFRHEALLVPRAVCVRLGPAGELSACFDPETQTYRLVWKDGFVRFSPVRHGFVDGLLLAGTPVEFQAQQAPPGQRVYRGFYRHGAQVAFAYNIDGRLYLDVPTVQEGRFFNHIAPADEHPQRHLIQAGPAQWPQELTAQITPGTGAPYAIDSIGVPFDNPWKAPMFFGGHDFLPDGSALLCTMQGDVWRVSGLDDPAGKVLWRRFASGLSHALGLVVHQGQVYVQCRDQLTRLHDQNQDGEADFYESFCRAFETSPAGHDFICGLERDGRGNFYTASGNQGLLRIASDGARVDVMATGFRNPDGLCVLPDGSISVPGSEGEWTPTSLICLIPPAIPPNPRLHFGYRGPIDDQPPAWPMVYLPRGLDNSAGGQTYIDSDRFGPLSHQIAHYSYGAGTWFLLLRDEVDGQAQGAVVPMPGDFPAAIHRGRVNPHDGQLYVSGMAGWGTYTQADGCFERIRYVGPQEQSQLPTAFHVHQNGVLLTFAEPLDPELATNPQQQFAQVWNYRYSSAYGSAEYAPSHPGVVGHERLEIASAHLLSDGRSLFLELPELQPVNQLHLRLRVGAPQPIDLFATINALDAPFTDFPGYLPSEKIIAAHPQLADMALVARPPQPNPWAGEIKEATPLALAAGKNLTFETRVLRAKAGTPIKLTFSNPDVVPHNWVLVRPGSLARVGDLTNRLVADPDAVLRHYVPESEDVLAYTDIVAPNQQFSIYFQAPAEPGQYPFLCTFPGHWMVMNGQLIVE
jgi:putative heme-binding domain-containing protein